MWTKCVSAFQVLSTEMAELLYVYIFSRANPCRDRPEQIHEYSPVHYVQLENVSLFCIRKFQFAPKAFDISWQCIVKFLSRWKISKCIFYQIKGIKKSTILMHAIGIPYFQEFSPIKDLMEAIPLCDIIQSYTNIHVYTQLFLLLMQLYFVLGDMFRLSQCSRVAIYTRIGKHTTQRHGVIHLTRIIISTKTPFVTSATKKEHRTK